MAASSLVVRISADITDFTKQLNAMTKGVDSAAKKIEGFGKVLTLGITVPVLGAAAALAKMAAENEDTGARLERVFGSAAASVNASIKKMMASVPEANTDLQKMAISVDNMAQGLGLAPGNAAKMSEALLKLAGDASAFAHVPMEQALDALSRGLAGKTRGLLQFGIAINEAEIKAKALSMGLVHQGNELTETGTALASYALIMERSTRIQGEAERTAGQAGKQFQFLKRDLGELADNVSHLVLPALSDLAKSARNVVDWFAKLDQDTVKTFFAIAAAAAVIGPAIAILANLVKGVFAVRAAFALLSAGGGIGAVIGGLASLPFTTIVLGIGAIATAVGLLVIAWEKLHKQDKSDFVGPRNITGPLGGSDPALNAALRINHTPDPGALAGLAAGTNAPTELVKAVDLMKQLEEKARTVGLAFKQIGEGWTVNGLTDQWAKLLDLAYARLLKIKDATSAEATALRGLISDLQEATSAALPSLKDLPGFRVTPSAPTPILPAKVEIAGPVASTLPQIPAQLSTMQQAMREGFMQVSVAIGDTLATRLATMFGGNGIGSQIGGSLGGAFGGGVGTVLGGAVASSVGGLIGAGLGSVVPVVGTLIGGALGSAIGGLFGRHKKEADHASTALSTLAKTVDRVTASITNVPAYFKIQYYRFTASPTMAAPGAQPVPTPYGGTPSPGGTYTPPVADPTSGTQLPGQSSTGNVIVQNMNVYASNYQDFVRQMSQANLRAANTGNASRLAFAG